MAHSSEDESQPWQQAAEMAARAEAEGSCLELTEKDLGMWRGSEASEFTSSFFKYEHIS